MALSGFRYTLRWDRDFSGLNEPPNGEPLSAFTVAKPFTTGGLDASKGTDGLYRIKHSSISVHVKMIKEESWYVRGLETDELLRHEQLHYNISALAGRDLERAFKNIAVDDSSLLFTEKSRIESEIQQKIDEVNEEYDSDILWGTNHGNKKLHQEFWEMHISKLMNDPAKRLEGMISSNMMKR